MDLVFDIETDDLNATKVWCIVAQDPLTGQIFKFTPDELQKGYEFLATADTLIGHNIIGFDIPMIHKFSDVDLSKIPVIDTLVLSRLFNPTREGGHSLENWGYKLGFNKIDFNDYLNYSQEMLDYCVRDVQLNTQVFKELRKESKGFSKDSIELEQGVARIIKQQETNGFKFDILHAELLLAELREKKQAIEDEVQKTFKPKWVDSKLVTPYIKKDGQLSKRGLTDEEYTNCLNTSNYNPFMRKTLQEFNLGSRKQIGEYLIDFGWKPDRFTPTGQPIVDEKTLSKITHIHEAKLIADFLLLQKRIAQIDSWFEAVTDDGRVHGFVIPNGTITGRMTHRNPNMAQVPSVSSPFGKECRACWTVEEGNVLLGVDASGLEIRMLAHYMADEEFINEIINGDIHTANQRLAQLESRDKAKTFIYALMYGAGDEKLGSVVGGSKADGRRARQHFFDNKPSFKSLRDRVQRASTKTYLKGIDGRKLYVRNQHSALNTLLQGAGSIVMKKALVDLDLMLRLNTIDYKFVANIHDEWQIEVKESQAEFTGSLAVDSIIKAGESFNLRCPLDGEYKIGGNWSETH
jgi:DNA polymerase I-like protein with 3'-5' exonuclease and polymerase domains|tara:strand:- start:10987 stop:12717 length:1731 start_codon:yes stop_codon:yes gene_type:complete